MKHRKLRNGETIKSEGKYTSKQHVSEEFGKQILVAIAIPQGGLKEISKINALQANVVGPNRNKVELFIDANAPATIHVRVLIVYKGGKSKQ